MNEGLRIGTIIFTGFVSLAVLAVILILAMLVFWQTMLVSDTWDNLDNTLEKFVDQQVMSGFAAPPLDPDSPLLARRKIVLCHEINARTAKDVVQQLFYLDSQDGTSPIELYLSTQGGYTDDAFAIIDAMRLIEAPVNVWAFGGCYSAGALILASATGRRHATDNVVLMVHTNLADSAAPFTSDCLLRRRYENVWRRQARLPDEWYPMTDSATYYLDAREALRFGIVDEIVHQWDEPSPGDIEELPAVESTP